MSLLGRTPVRIGRAQRDARDDRVFLVASEDTHAPKQYFEAHTFRRVKVFVLPTEDGRSAPAHMVERLRHAYESAKERKEGQPNDEFWLLLDTDHWIKDQHLPRLLDALSQARKTGLNFKQGTGGLKIRIHFIIIHAIYVDYKILRYIKGRLNCKISLVCRPNPWHGVWMRYARMKPAAPTEAMYLHCISRVVNRIRAVQRPGRPRPAPQNPLPVAWAIAAGSSAAISLHPDFPAFFPPGNPDCFNNRSRLRSCRSADSASQS